MCIRDRAHWDTLVRARAIENSVFIIATNMCGTHHSGRKTYGHSRLFDPWGNIEALSVMKLVKDQFDPDKRLNPGRGPGGI